MPQRETLIPKISRGETCAERKEPAAERLSEQQNVGFDVFMFASEESPRAAKARLHFIENESDAILRGNFSRSCEIARRRQVDTAFALDRFEEERRYSRTIAGKTRGQCVRIAEFHSLKAGRKRPESLSMMRLPR